MGALSVLITNCKKVLEGLAQPSSVGAIDGTLDFVGLKESDGAREGHNEYGSAMMSTIS